MVIFLSFVVLCNPVQNLFLHNISHFHNTELIQSTRHLSMKIARHRFDPKNDPAPLLVGGRCRFFFTFYLSCLASHTAASKNGVHETLLRSFSIYSFVHNERAARCPSADVQTRQACRFMKPRSILTSINIICPFFGPATTSCHLQKGTKQILVWENLARLGDIYRIEKEADGADLKQLL